MEEPSIEVQYYNNDLLLPIVSSGKEEPPTTKDIVSMIISGDIPLEQISTATPVYVQNNVEFIVDTSRLADWRDVKYDGMAGMSRNVTKKYLYSLVNNKLELALEDEHQYKATRFVYSHKKYSDFHKIIITVTVLF